MDTRVYGAGFEQYTPQKQQRIALGRTVAEEGMVLLENNGALPLAPGSKVALLGVGQLGFLHGGSGSGGTLADYVVKLPEAMTNAGAQVDAELLSCYTEYCAAQQKEIEKVPPFMRGAPFPKCPFPGTCSTPLPPVLTPLFSPFSGWLAKDGTGSWSPATIFFPRKSMPCWQKQERHLISLRLRTQLYHLLPAGARCQGHSAGRYLCRHRCQHRQHGRQGRGADLSPRCRGPARASGS